MGGGKKRKGRGGWGSTNAAATAKPPLPPLKVTPKVGKKEGKKEGQRHASPKIVKGWKAGRQNGRKTGNHHSHHSRGEGGEGRKEGATDRGDEKGVRLLMSNADVHVDR